MMTDSPPNPYQNRDHENLIEKKSLSDVKAVAALLGSVSGQLKDIDQKQISGNEFTKANKMNAQQALKAFAKGTPDAETPTRNKMPPTTLDTAAPPSPEQIPPPVSSNSTPGTNTQMPTEVEERLSRLERQMSIYKKTFKFKRGISYNVNTASIKGNFKDPDDIVDIVLSELAKSSKSITIKLNDTTKNK